MKNIKMNRTWRTTKVARRFRAVWCLTLGTAAILFGFATEGRGEEGNSVTITADTPWVVAIDEPEAVQRALADVERDWYKVLGHRPVVLNEPPKAWRGLVVYLGTKGAWLKELAKEVPDGAESFVLRVQRDAEDRQALVATGADVRGAIYGAYALAEEILGVDPWYYWVDKEPAFRGRIEVPSDFNKRFGPPTFKYRGWFINDEDLLSGFAPDPLRENIFSPEMLDRICETLLRLRGNLIVPGTFMFPDERNNEVCFRRGLALNFHHIQVLGLNTWRWPKDVPFSYERNPEEMESYWQTCLQSLKDKEVVWTVGYRGKHDRPFWSDEQGMDTPAARGAAISKAIARQVEMVRKMQPQAPIINNLWMEGARLYHEGHIKLPAGVTTVWADDGTGIIQDEGRVKAGQGIYYHTAMLSGRHNQLSEMVPPGRIYSEVGRFLRAGATEYFLVNVSDVRPVPLSTDCAMRLVWNARPYRDRSDQENQDAFFADWCRRQYGSEVAAEAARIYALYFDIPYHRRSARTGDNYMHPRLRALAAAAEPLVSSGKPLDEKIMKTVQDQLQYVGGSRSSVAAVAAQAEALTPLIPTDRRQFYQGHLLTQAQIHLRSLDMLAGYSRALEAYAQGDKPGAIGQAEEALGAIDDLMATLRAAEYGKWAGWYRGEGFVGVELSRHRVRRLLAALRGQPMPVDRPGLGYEVVYEYQEPFRKNFPLFYPAQTPKMGDSEK